LLKAILTVSGYPPCGSRALLLGYTKARQSRFGASALV
jgi:hypothetical protein